MKNVGSFAVLAFGLVATGCEHRSPTQIQNDNQATNKATATAVFQENAGSNFRLSDPVKCEAAKIVDRGDDLSSSTDCDYSILTNSGQKVGDIAFNVSDDVYYEQSGIHVSTMFINKLDGTFFREQADAKLKELDLSIRGSFLNGENSTATVQHYVVNDSNGHAAGTVTYDRLKNRIEEVKIANLSP